MTLPPDDTRATDADDPRLALAASPAERERAYSPSRMIGGDWSPYRRQYAERSAEARAAAGALGARWVRLETGPRPTQAVWLCLPGQAGPDSPVPLLLFVHGGYWQDLGAEDSLFAAPELVARGIAFAALDYTLAPALPLSGIVAECRRSWEELVRQAPKLGIDPDCIVISGSSAGAHLASMIALDPGIGCAPPCAAVLVSGVYRIEPLLGTGIAAPLGLDPELARLCSPWHQPLNRHPPATICWGAVETPAFRAQGEGFARRLALARVPVHCFEVPQRNHFDVVLELATAGTALGDATLARLAATA